MKVKNDKTKTNGVEVIFNIKLQLLKLEKELLEYRPTHFKRKSPGRGPE